LTPRVHAATTARTFHANITPTSIPFTPPAPVSLVFPYTTLFRSSSGDVILSITQLLTVNAKVDGGQDLFLNTAGGATFNAAVGRGRGAGGGTPAPGGVGAPAWGSEIERDLPTPHPPHAHYTTSPI